jgi:hypothetical protein
MELVHILNNHKMEEWQVGFHLRGYDMEINVEKTKTMRISRQPTPLQMKIDKKNGGECGRVKLFR